MDKVQEFFTAMESKISRKIEKKKRLYFEVKDKDIREVVDFLFNKMGCRLSTATATELYYGLEVLYHFSHDDTGQYFCPRIFIKDKKKPSMNSITPIVKGAEWIEREMFDLWGINFEGHPRMEKLLTGNNSKNHDKPLRLRRDNG